MRIFFAVVFTVMCIYDLVERDYDAVFQSAVLGILFWMWLDLNGKIKGLKSEDSTDTGKRDG